MRHMKILPDNYRRKLKRIAEYPLKAELKTSRNGRLSNIAKDLSWMRNSRKFGRR